MKKLLTTIALLFLAVIIGGGIYAYIATRNTPATAPNTGPGVSPFGGNGGSIPPGGTTGGSTTSGTTTEPFVVPGADGSSISVEDFRMDPGVKALPDGSYLISSTASGTPYQILYYAHDQSFTVTLFAEPLGETRLTAQDQLINMLQIDKSQMCRLRYGVYVPIKVSQFYAATNLGFSFCPRAVKLP